jgi:protease-4
MSFVINFIKGLNSAYENNKALKAVILRIDSPGGSPVQADYMYNSIQFYKKKYPDVKIYAVCVDMCASAAYYVAAAADEIYANPSSLVGSIGVLYNGFGFVDTMQKLGVTRRLHTAGINKGFLDQFSPDNPAQGQLLQTMLDLIHQQFIDRVKAGRGQRLVIDKDTFSGLFWTGIQAKERGLIDGFASSGQVARDIIKIDRVVDYTVQESVIERFSKQMGTAIANQLPLALGMKPGIY